MILPGTHLLPGRSLIGVGGDILAQLMQPQDVSGLWDAFHEARVTREAKEPVTFDWFVTALTFLYTIGAVRMEGGLIVADWSDL